MMLADMGADVLLVDRPGGTDLGLKRERWMDVMMRGKRSVDARPEVRQPAPRRPACWLCARRCG